jgi:CSLREA domain-containing protein
VVLAFALAMLAAAPAGADTFNVNSTMDSPDVNVGDGACFSGQGCTLRAAIQEANFSTMTADTIVVPAGSYVLTRTGAPETASVSGDLDIVGNVRITGAGARTTVVNGNAPTTGERVFHVLSGATNVAIEGLTITGGSSVSFTVGGGGVLNEGTTTLSDVAVVANAVGSNPGGGIRNQSGSLTLTRVLVAHHETSGQGAGIASSATLTIENSTLSDNSTTNAGGAISHTSSTQPLSISYATIASNKASASPSDAISHSGLGVTIRNSIIAGACTPSTASSGGSNVATGTSCGLTQSTDRQGTDPQLGPLANNGGPTDTHALAATSPAIDLASGACPAVDQRSFSRPVGVACDSGAFEFRTPAAAPPVVPSTLVLDPTAVERRPGDANIVAATVRNGDGSAAANAIVRYAIAGPNAGLGTATTDASGRAAISWRGVHTGTDTLSAYVDVNGNGAPDSEPSASATVTWSLPTPKQGRTVNLEPLSGIVIIRLPAGTAKRRAHAAASTSITLSEARQVPVGTIVDVRKGHVDMTVAAAPTGDSVQKGEFWGGVYQSVQPRTGARVVTDLRLTESLKCQPNTRGRVTAARARSRKLWGRGKGRFRTRGRHSAATVRGTTWLQKDTCTTTTTVVREGVVTVTDFAKRKDVRVKAGERYVARARARRR